MHSAPDAHANGARDWRADAKPPSNMLFICKLNPVTTEEDLDIIFSRCVCGGGGHPQRPSKEGWLEFTVLR